MDKISGSIKSKGSLSGEIKSKGVIDGKFKIYQRLVNDYNDLENKPSIENITLVGNKMMSDFGDREITNFEIKDIINRVFKSGGH